MSANAAQVQAVDSLPLANLTTSINFFEVPEIHTAHGRYYDLLNQFDFRPSAANTSAPTTNAALATVNPTAPVPSLNAAAR